MGHEDPRRKNVWRDIKKNDIKASKQLEVMANKILHTKFQLNIFIDGAQIWLWSLLLYSESDIISS